jgi:hypothetical protein
MSLLKVKIVGPGMFSTETAVEIQAGDRTYTLFAPANKVKGDTLEVEVIAYQDGEALVDLPRETFTSGRRISVPRGLVLGT